MSEFIPKRLATRVRRRARNLFEYCRLPQWSQEATFHIDHVQPHVDGGRTVLSNLALACVTCSLKKGSRTHAIDPVTRMVARLFHPRRDNWRRHFRWTQTWRIAGRTPIGRATLRALGFNRPPIVIIRQIWARLGVFPTVDGGIL